MDGSFVYLLHFDEIDELIIHAYVKWLRRANETTCSIMAMAAKRKKKKKDRCWLNCGWVLKQQAWIFNNKTVSNTIS